MNQILNLLFFIFIIVVIPGCNTLYNSRTINLEVAVPGKSALPSDYKKIAVKYNNCNVDQQAGFNNYLHGNETLVDTSEIESLASRIYFDLFLENVKKNNFIDSIIEIEPADFTGVQLIDSLIEPITLKSDSLLINGDKKSETIVSYFANFLKRNPVVVPNAVKTKLIDSKYGLYSKTDIQQIADSTNADILLSLDYFNSLDGIFFSSVTNIGVEFVFPMVYWNVYDLRNESLNYFYERADTITWDALAQGFKHTKKLLPPRKDAILNAADIAGTRFAELLSPHWVEVERMYYRSGHIELKKTNQLIAENKWMEAAKIWKANINNPNKYIAAKCMFNMALVCEIEGNCKTAIDWVVQSFHVFGQKNEVHYYNCISYIQILSQRLLDIKRLDFQLNSRSL